MMENFEEFTKNPLSKEAMKDVKGGLPVNIDYCSLNRACWTIADQNSDSGAKYQLDNWYRSNCGMIP